MTGDSGPLLKKEVTYWLGIIVLVIGFAVSWGVLNERVDNLCAKVQEQTAQIDALEVKLTAYNDEVNKIDVRLARIETDIAYIRLSIEGKTP